MIDWHSHILPGVDDGSKSVDESLLMLGAMREQGVGLAIATPHFYANDERVDTFLERRERAYSLLNESLSKDLPRVLCGAEVKYYPGISKMADLDKLKIGETKLILIEMPMVKWTEYTVRELVELTASRNLTVIMAHIERYLSMQSTATWERLYESGLLMQVNASFFCGIGTKHKALRLLDDGKIHFIGSDCHNMSTRPPMVNKAYELIERKFGEDYTSQMIGYGYSMLEL